MSKGIVLNSQAMLALEAAGIETKTGVLYTGSEEKYSVALQSFCDGYPSRSQSLRDGCRDLREKGPEEETISLLTIEAHALKGNARMIGAGTLAQLAEALELRGRRGELGGIIQDTEPVLQEYKRVVEALQLQLQPLAEETPQQTANGVHMVIDQILTALGEFDDDLAARLTQELLTNEECAGVKADLAKLDEYIDDFLYDEAEELARQIKERLGE